MDNTYGDLHPGNVPGLVVKRTDAHVVLQTPHRHLHAILSSACHGQEARCLCVLNVARDVKKTLRVLKSAGPCVLCCINNCTILYQTNCGYVSEVHYVMAKLNPNYI